MNMPAIPAAAPPGPTPAQQPSARSAAPRANAFARSLAAAEEQAPPSPRTETRVGSDSVDASAQAASEPAQETPAKDTAAPAPASAQAEQAGSADTPADLPLTPAAAAEVVPQPAAPQPATVADVQLPGSVPHEAPPSGAAGTTASDVPAASAPVAAAALPVPAAPAPAAPAAAAPVAAADAAATPLPVVAASAGEDAKGKAPVTTEEEVGAESLTAALFGAKAPEGGKGRIEAQPGAKRPSAAEQTGTPAEASAVPGDGVRPAAGAVPQGLPQMPDAPPDMLPGIGAAATAVKGTDAPPVATRQDAPTSAQPSLLPAAAPVLPASAPQPASATTYAAPFRSYVQAPPAAQVAPAVVSVAARGGVGGAPSRLVVAIHPAELGQVEVAVEQVVDGVPQVRILAERPETLIMLQRDRSAIEAALRQAGLTEGAASSLSFGLSENSQGNGRRQETHRRGAGGRTGDLSDSVGPLNTAIATARSAPRGLLDLAL